MVHPKELSKFANTLNILFVEDEELLREEVCETLTVFFNRVDCANDGVDALELYNEEYKQNNTFYDIIITDINMPNMNGIELIKEIKKTNPEQMVIIISASNESKKIIELIEYGIDSFILKPMDHDTFMNSLYKTSKMVINNKLEKELLKTNLLLTEYAKLSTLSWLMDSISYQWKQHLNLIKTDSSCIELKVESDIDISNNEMLFTTKNINIQVDYLDRTMSEFKNIFKTNMHKEYTSLMTQIKKVYELIKYDLSSKQIEFEITSKEDINALTRATDFKYIIVNLVKNSIDNFISNDITQDRRILFHISEDEGNNTVVKVMNNAGIINDNIIQDIFHTNSITKYANSATELTLYMSKILVERNGGKINVLNNEEGSCFKILLPNP